MSRRIRSQRQILSLTLPAISKLRDRYTVTSRIGVLPCMGTVFFPMPCSCRSVWTGPGTEDERACGEGPLAHSSPFAT
jgi:hypothetical protein